MHSLIRSVTNRHQYGIFSIFLALFMINPTLSLAANFGAELTEIEGRVFVTKGSTGKTVPATEGMRIGAGDKIETKPEAAVDILYDDGNVTAMDENTVLTIKKLSLKPGEKASVVDLGIGRIKNSVTKIVNIRASFEVRTKSAVAGVTGTPPWVVAVMRDKQGKFSTEVDLLTRGKDMGGLFVRGTDPGATEIRLRPGTRTVSAFGIAPQKPFRISVARSLSLKKAIPIKVKPEKREEKRKKIEKRSEQLTKKKKQGDKKKKPAKKKEKKAESKSDSRENVTAVERSDKERKGDGKTADQSPALKESKPTAEIDAPPAMTVDTDTMLDHVTRSVSVGDVVAPTESETGETTEGQTSQGSVTTETKDALPPTTRVKIKVDIAR